MHVLLMMMMLVMLMENVDVAQGYGSGAPPKACGSMTPGHGTEQTVPNTHTVTYVGDQYQGVENIEITISGVIQGILLQARLADGSSEEPYGTYTVDPSNNVKVTSCGEGANNTVTHGAIPEKTDLKVTWHPPAEDVGTLEFIATIAEEKEVWWKNTKSSPLAYTAGGAGGNGTTGGAQTESSMTTGAGAGGSTTKSSGEDGEEPSGGNTLVAPFTWIFLSVMVVYSLLPAPSTPLTL